VAIAGAVGGRWRFWVGVAAGFLLLLWLLNDILLPFVVGAVVAYFFDPVVVRLQRAGLSRTWATAVVTIAAALLAVGAAMAIVPPLFGQVQALIVKAPEYAVQAARRIEPMVEPLRTKLGLPPLGLQQLQAELSQWAGQALGLIGGVAGRVAQRGVAIINLFALLFLTPVVTFYLLRELAEGAWRRSTGRCRSTMPARSGCSPMTPTRPWRDMCAGRRWSVSASARSMPSACRWSACNSASSSD
jgi:predicted PurR-regulated permease PerM